MPKKTGTKNKAKSTPKTKVINRNKNTNINNVHVHVEKPKTRKRRTTKPKAEPNNNPLSNSINSLSRGSSQNLGFHPRGLINNEIQQPTIVHQIQAPPDPRIDKLEKRSKKIKEYLKGKGDTKDNAINVNSSILATPAAHVDIFTDTIEPKKLNFENVSTIPKKKGFLGRLFSTGKKNIVETNFSTRQQDPFKDAIESPPPLLTLEYKPEKPPASAPAYLEEANGKRIIQELKVVVNQLHESHPNSKLTMAPFRSAIASKLRQLGVGTSHTAAYVKQMREFYDEIYAFHHGVEPAGGAM